MIIASMEEIPGKKISRVLGMAYGTSAKSMDVLGNAFGEISSKFGGSQRGFASTIGDARREAVDNMVKDAETLDADGVVCMRLSVSEFGGSGKSDIIHQVTAYGTAVKFEVEGGSAPINVSGMKRY